MQRLLARLRRFDRLMLLPVLLALAVLIPGITWGLPAARDGDSTFPWGYDEIAALPPLVEARAGFRRPTDGYLPYPLFHYVVLTATYAPYLGAEWSSGNFAPTAGFPYGMADPPGMSKTLTLIARGVSIMMAVGCVLFVFGIGRLLGLSRGVATGVCLAVALLPTFVYYGKSANLDVPYVFWTLATLYTAANIIFGRRSGTWSFVRLGIFAALAVCTKDQAYGFLMAVPPLLLACLWAQSDGALPWSARLWQTLGRRALWLGLVASLVTFTLGNNLIFGWQGFQEHIRQAVEMSARERAHASDVAGQFALLGDTAEQIAWTLGPALLVVLMGAVGLIQQRRWLVLAFLLLPILSHQLLVLGRIGYCYPRFMLLPAILLTLLAGAAFKGLASRLASWALLAVTPLAFTYLGVMALDLTWAQLADARYEAERHLSAQTRPGAVVESYTRFSRLLPELPRDTHAVLVSPMEMTAEHLERRKPDFILLSDLNDQGVLERPEVARFVADLRGGKLGYRVVLERETPSYFGRRFVRCLAPKVTLLAREPAQVTWSESHERQRAAFPAP